MKLDQVNKDGPLNLQEQVLLVLLKLGMQPVDHALASRLGAELAFEDRSQRVESPAQVVTQVLEGFPDRSAVDRRNDRDGFLRWRVARPGRDWRWLGFFRQPLEDIEPRLIISGQLHSA